MKTVILAMAMIATAFGPAMSQDQEAKSLQIHGYFTQAAAINSKYQWLGLPKEGSFDYRNLALQFRYDASEADAILFQFSHKRVGKSNLMKSEPDVRLDWGFYQHKFTEQFGIKVGRVQMPAGIYNEIRDVGVVLPFYRAPFGTYFEGEYASETIDGAVASYAIAKGSMWSADLDAFVGHFETVETSSSSANRMVNAPRSFGGQVWLNTPVDGLRAGVSGYRAQVEGGFIFDETNIFGGKQWMTNYRLSLDLNREKYLVRGEYTGLKFHDGDFGSVSYYAQAGYRLTDKLGVYAQYDHWGVEDFPIDLSQVSPGLMPRFNFGRSNDIGLSVNYAFQPSVVLKAEAHQVESISIENGPERMPVNYSLGGMPILVKEDPYKFMYFILSLSVSF